MAGGEGHLSGSAAFAQDDGSPDVLLRAALDAGDAEATLARLREGARLLVPIVAVLDEAGEDGSDKSSHMASVSLVQSDGRRGLLAFTSIDTLRAWDPAARPVPALAPSVARAALEEEADGVLVDIAGPVRFALDGLALEEVAGAGPAAID